jgi:hypothetical protein
MADFCRKKGLVINTKLEDKYRFIDTAYSNAGFLEKIKTRIQKYVEGGKKFTYEPLLFEPNETTKEGGQKPPIARDNTRVDNQIHRQADLAAHELKEINHNELIRRLRHEYLHWNTAYGENIVNTIIQPYEPNIVDGKRKREVR